MQRPQQRRSSLPASYDERVRLALKKRGYSLDQPKALADAVKKLSDFYLENPTARTPWDDVWAQVASLVYFFPLNYSRAALVAREAERLGFFTEIDSVTDDGAGMGSGLLAFVDHITGKQNRPSTWLARDVSPESLDLLRELSDQSAKIEIEVVQGLNRGGKKTAGAKSLLLASYVFTELADLPKEWLEHEALILIEPSTREDARRLQAQRERLQAAGFELWAPCPHQDACPLLIHSEKDWCHDRLHFDPPSWFTDIEKFLPMKNRTLSFSYLAARKKPSPVSSRKREIATGFMSRTTERVSRLVSSEVSKR
jgi:Mitochondrial small ribosomal subunit Rsm22